jgi:methylmalonyl-CoA mutase cobalamin-binding domain/chain
METELCRRLARAIIDLDSETSRRIAEEAVKQKLDGRRLIQEGVQEGLKVIGKKFSEYEIFLSDMIAAADVAKAALEIILPSLSETEAEFVRKGRVVIGTVKGDIHDIGKNIVAALLTASGFEVFDIGVDVDVPFFLEKAEEVKASIIAMSALFTAALPYQKEVIDFLEAANARERYYVIIGGGAVTPQWAEEIKADGYGKTAGDAVELCRQLLELGNKPPLATPICIGGQRSC